MCPAGAREQISELPGPVIRFGASGAYNKGFQTEAKEKAPKLSYYVYHGSGIGAFRIYMQDAGDQNKQ